MTDLQGNLSRQPIARPKVNLQPDNPTTNYLRRKVLEQRASDRKVEKARAEAPRLQAEYAKNFQRAEQQLLKDKLDWQRKSDAAFNQPTRNSPKSNGPTLKTAEPTLNLKKTPGPIKPPVKPTGSLGQLALVAGAFFVGYKIGELINDKVAEEERDFNRQYALDIQNHERRMGQLNGAQFTNPALNDIQYPFLGGQDPAASYLVYVGLAEKVYRANLDATQREKW